MRSPTPGDRIELVAMPDDQNPIPPGTKGTIKSVWQRGISPGDWLQIDVQWDNGRQLMLVVPPDQFVFIHGDVEG